MSERFFSTALAGALACCVTGCAGRFDPAHFEGSREPRRVEPEAVKVVAVATADVQTLGKVGVSCRLRPGFRRLEGELLSDLDCSTDRLLWTLRESAASAGGELLVGVNCGSESSKNTAQNAQDLLCTAEVARSVASRFTSLRPLSVPRSVAPGLPAPSASDVRRSDEPDASLAFRISLAFEPKFATFDQPAVGRDQVQDLPRLPIADRALGDLVASCATSCDERALRYGVLLAAGRLGARDVIGLRCFDSGPGLSCVGTLAAPERSE